jgi:hypothetical protein
MDNELIVMLADYLEKTGSVGADVRQLVERQQRYIDAVSHRKTASVSMIRKQALDTALKMANVRLPGTGAPLIAGADQVKQAGLLLTDHEQSITLLNKVLDTFQSESSKRASLEPGRGTLAGRGAGKRTLTADEQLRVDFGLPIDSK